MSKHAWLTMALAVALLSPGRPATADLSPPKINPPASAAASAAPQAAAGEAKAFDEDPPPSGTSAAPTVDEWKSAPAIKLAHNVAACKSYRVREWLKVHCEGFPAAGASLLAGQQTGLLLWVDQASESGNDVMKKPRAVDVILPVRRGDGRMVQIAQFGEGYDGPLGWNVAYVVSEQWVEGEAAPVISMW